MSEPALKSLVVSLHDLHPGSFQRVRAQRKTLLAMGVSRCSLLVVPWWHGGERTEADPEFCAWLRRRMEAGDEIVLHGWRHDCAGQPEPGADWFWRRFYTADECEFLTLTREEATHRLEAGRASLEAAGLRAEGFIAPAWLLGLPAREALRRLGFSYTTTANSVEVLQPPLQTLASRSLCWSVRSWWRRLLSVPWNAQLRARRLAELGRAEGGVIRVSLHPNDFHHGWVRAQILESVGRALEAGCRPETYLELVNRLRFSS